MILRNEIDLIGDFLGTIPAMQEYALRNECSVQLPTCAMQPFLTMAGLRLAKPFEQPHCNLDLHKAFNFAAVNNLHMTQAFFPQLGMDIPAEPVRPQLTIGITARDGYLPFPSYDFIIAPFSRSLPNEQKWQRENWQALVNSMSDKKFLLFGDSRFDDKDFLVAGNLYHAFDYPFDFVCAFMKAARCGVISVVTGISHLAYALNVKNYLFVNQGAWGKNPEAIYFNGYIPTISVEEVISKLR